MIWPHYILIMNFNVLGFLTLYRKEVMRFLKVYNQTLFAPMVNSLLFLSVFSLALGDRIVEVSGVPFEKFMVCGLIMMTVIQNAFANTSSTITFGKVLGSIIDVLIPPLSPFEITLAMTLGGITRGIMSGLAVAVAISFFVEMGMYDFWVMCFYLIFAAMMLALLGMIAGIYSDSFDQMSAVTSYVITPLSFLSGTFYSIKRLPEFWQEVNYYNPFFYMVDGFRYSLTGHSDADITTGMIYLICFNIVLFTIVYTMLKKGYRIKS